MKISLSTCFLALVCNLFGQKINVSVRYNNFQDAADEKIAQIQSHFTTDDILSSLKQNPYISERMLNIDVVFFDEKKLGTFDLKRQHLVTTETYLSRWHKTNDQFQSILILYLKTGQANDYLLNQIAFSGKLSSDYFLPAINDYLNARFKSTSPQELTHLGSIIGKLLKPIWNAQKMDQAQLLVTESKYKKGHVNKFHGLFGFQFFDLKPADTSETKGLVLVNAWNHQDVNKTDWFFSNKYIFTDDQYLKGFKKSNIFQWDISFEKDGIRNVYIFKDAFLFSLLDYIERSERHLDTYASNLTWVYKKASSPPRYIENISTLPNRSSSNRLILFYNNGESLSEGQPIPKIAPFSENTWCNVFACDLSNQVLFGNIFGDIHTGPWGSNDCANILHHRISSDSDNFREITLDEAWWYTSKGFPVFLSMFNKSLDINLLNADKKDIPCSPSGHISICYPEETYLQSKPFKEQLVIQGGSETGIVQYFNAIPSSYDGKVKAHIYLGYLNH